MTWWSWREVNTRSHPELGRENSQRRWYSVSRRGRVGRRQVFPMQAAKRIRYSNVTPPHAGWSSPRRREPTIKKNRALDPFDRNNAGWSSPVARQAHNLKVAGSNPAPATNPSTRNQAKRPVQSRTGAFCFCAPLCRESGLATEHIGFDGLQMRNHGGVRSLRVAAQHGFDNRAVLATVGLAALLRE